MWHLLSGFWLNNSCFKCHLALTCSPPLQINSVVMSMVDLYFPPSTGVSIIAEPGSFFVSSAFTLAVNIISKEVVARDCQDEAHGQWHHSHQCYTIFRNWQQCSCQNVMFCQYMSAETRLCPRLCSKMQSESLTDCVSFSVNRWPVSQRRASVPVLHERGGVRIVCQQTLWNPDRCSICSQGQSQRLVSSHCQNYTIAPDHKQARSRWVMCTLCVWAEHVPGGSSVQQQPVGSLWRRLGPGGGALPAARARPGRLAHLQPRRGLQSGPASGQQPRLSSAPGVLRHLLQRLVRICPPDLFSMLVLKRRLTHACFPPGSRCRTVASPMSPRWRTSRWSLISSIPAKQRPHCLSQLSDHQTRKTIISPLLISAASFLWPTFHRDELNQLHRVLEIAGTRLNSYQKPQCKT